MIKSFDKRQADALALEIESALREIGQKHGVTIRRNGGRFGASEFDMKLLIKVNDLETVANVEQGKWNMNCYALGLLPSDYGMEFSCPQGRYRITGVATNRRKYPIKARDLTNGKDILLSQGYVPWIKSAREKQQKEA